MKKLKLYERACSSLVLRFSFHQQLLILFIGLFLISNNIVAGANYQDQQEEFTISGKVTASDIGPLPGATVLIVGTQQGTVTDGEGNFQIKVKANDRLLISFVGYASQEVVVSANQTNYSITMAPDLEELSEIVVVGYGTVKKSHLTGAISKVEAEGMEQIAVSRADEALVGKVSGVNIQATTSEAGAPPTIRIRGTGSITAGAGPLVVIDGVPVDYEFLQSVDMNDVESFEVLKDAASAAIFGSRGANGVIMITTKQGKQGQTKFSYNGFTGFQDVATNPNYNTSLAETAAAELAATGELSARTRYKQLIGVDHNWQDIIFDGGTINSHALSARGGNEKTNFSTSLSYLHDEGVLLTDDFKKYNFKAKVDTRVNDVVEFGVSLNPSYTNRRRFDGSTHDILRQTPWLPIYHDENTIQFVDRTVYPDVQVGDYALQRHFDNYDLDGDGVLIDISNTSNTNPYAKVWEREYNYETFRIFGSSYIKLNLMEGLSFRGALSGNYSNEATSRYQGILAHRNGAANAQSYWRDIEKWHLVSEGFFNYNKSIDVHDISAVLGISAETWRTDWAEAERNGYTFDFIQTLNAGTNITQGTTYAREKAYLSFVGRVNYSFADKYLASVSFRRDGSSVFGSDTKFGNFPAASLGWRISEEAFLRGSSLVSNLKVRISYGITGNDAINTSDDLLDWYAYQGLLGSTTPVVDGVVLAPILVEETLAICTALEQAGIPYLFVDSNLAETKPLLFIGQDSQKTGYLAAKLLNLGYPDGCQTYIIRFNDFDSLNKTIDERIEGFRSYYFDKGIDDCLISEIGLNTSWQALLYEADKLKSQGQSLHIFVPNSRAYEVSAALKDFTGTTRIVGIDLVEGNRHCLRKGTIDFVIDQNPAYQGSEAIRSFYKLKVAKEPISDLKIPLTIYTAENL